ncbi:MAG: putative toxin-antitoxin system toxin component, PIN family [Pseudomonadales bacterium]
MSNTVVIDTNVLVSALIGPKGPNREVIRGCLTGAYNPLISNALFQEYEDVTSRDNIVKLCPLSPNEARELLNALYSVCQWVPIYYLWRPNLPDEGDNFLVELAVAGNATCIVTNNVRDIKASELSFPDLHVLTPEELLRG